MRPAAPRWRERLGREIFALRGQTAMPMFSTDAGLDRAAALAASAPGKPVVIADVWDNPGGGVAGDGTLILRRMLERGIDDVAVATIWDPIAVSFCRAAGEGARDHAPLRRQGGPRRWRADRRARRGAARGRRIAGRAFGQSRRAARAQPRWCGSKAPQIDVILNTNRTQTFEPDIFVNLGIDPACEATCCW